MVYVKVKEETAEKLHLSREPALTAWAMLVGFAAFGLGAAYYGNDHFLWKIIYVSCGILVGLSCMDDWEECELDKALGQVRLKKQSIWDMVLTPITGKGGVIVANLAEVVGVQVEEEKVNFFGTSHQVVLQFSTGMAIGVTETFTFGSTQEHHQVAEMIRKFLGLDNQDALTDTAEDSSQDEEASADDEEEDTADDFEQIDKSELAAEMENSGAKQCTDDQIS